MKPLAVADAIPQEVAAGAIGVELGDVTSPAADTRASARGGQSDAADRIARLVIIALFSFMAVRIGADYLETGRLTGLLLLASEALVVVLTVFRRMPVIVDRSLEARVLTALSVLGPPMVRPALLEPLMPEAMTVAFSACGLLVVIGGKLSLGRSFGLMPANRGIVSSGLYRIVRHPIYMGYLVTHAAFIAANPSPWNLVVLVMADTALLARALCEERTLARDPEYRQYQGVVRWRVVPGLF
jgi:protein-S-isoprenylcysteine O-methyltransferase Ste14